jgi:hypothetical protein
MAKQPYDDDLYLKNNAEIGRLAGQIFDMEGSDIGTIEDIFEQVLDGLREDDEDED